MIPQPNARPAVIDEFNSVGFEGHLNVANGHGAASYRFNAPRLHVPDRVHIDFGRVRNLLLIHTCQRAGSLPTRRHSAQRKYWTRCRYQRTAGRRYDSSVVGRIDFADPIARQISRRSGRNVCCGHCTEAR
jgi:hypothetical protein